MSYCEHACPVLVLLEDPPDDLCLGLEDYPLHMTVFSDVRVTVDLPARDVSSFRLPGHRVIRSLARLLSLHLGGEVRERALPCPSRCRVSARDLRDRGTRGLLRRSTASGHSLSRSVRGQAGIPRTSRESQTASDLAPRGVGQVRA